LLNEPVGQRFLWCNSVAFHSEKIAE
jgi:hypothetical protein